MLTINELKMNTLDKSLFSFANTDFRNRDFSRAVDRYHEALRQAHEPIAKQIRFNLELAQRRASGLISSWPLQSIIQVELRPLHQIVPDPQNSQAWISVGEDPYFAVDFHGLTALKAGWYQIDVEIQTSKKRFVAGLYPDFGEGFSEASLININCTRSTRVQRIVRFDQNVLKLRFDPFDSSGSFWVHCFTISQLTEQQALTAMSLALIQQKNAEHDSVEDFESVDDTYKKYLNQANGSQTEINYLEWIEEIEQKTLPSAEDVIENLGSMKLKPLMSVVLPTYNTAEKYLRSCIDSVVRQSYPLWQLCIADDASTQPHVRRLLDEYQKNEPRIKVVYRKENGHISRASNSALELATGQFVALLDHDDELPEHALYFVALAINETPSAKVIYSDEDKIDAEGLRSQPHFKSDWNPDLFYSQNYVSHLGVYKRELLTHIGGFRVGVEGSQDQDLLLRCLPHVRENEIVHIPRILYHWRALEGSTALASGEKSYTTEAGIRALRDHFESNGPEGVKVEAGLLPNTYRVLWPIPEPQPLVSLLIPTRDKKTITEIAVRSILDKTTYRNYEILILDNGSVETETLEWFTAIQRQDRRVRVLRYDKPFNYSAINNFGVRHAAGSLIGLINNDVEVISPEWLTEMVSHAVRPDIGCVGAKLYYSDGRIQHGGVIIGLGGVAGHSHKFFSCNDSGYCGRLKLVQNLSAVTAACLLVKKYIYQEVEGLDETHLAVAFNDVDFCLKVNTNGYRNLWSPYVELYHHESLSRGYEDTPEKQKRFEYEIKIMKQRWDDVIKKDRYYNPNLTRDREDFSINNV